MKKRESTPSWFKTYQKVRRDWGVVSPATKVVPNKKGYQRHEKHKRKEFKENYES